MKQMGRKNYFKILKKIDYKFIILCTAWAMTGMYLFLKVFGL